MFRRWGIGTFLVWKHYNQVIVSHVPKVGYRNELHVDVVGCDDCITCSEGGVSERPGRRRRFWSRLYHMFRRWGIGTESSMSSVAFVLYHMFRRWGIGTQVDTDTVAGEIVSHVPKVGYRNGDTWRGTCASCSPRARG